MGRDLKVRRESENLPVVSCTYKVFPRLVHGAAIGLHNFIVNIRPNGRFASNYQKSKTVVPLAGTAVFLFSSVLAVRTKLYKMRCVK
jgi:hypothetical protein